MTDSPASRPLANRLVLVTGASRGIGRASALALAKAGAHVIAVARTQGGLEALDDEIQRETGEGATLVPLDLADGDKIDQLGGLLFERFKRLDGLVHAAATLGLLTPVSHMSPRDWDRTVRLNLTASYRLIRSFEPLLKASDAGRAVFLTSSVATKPRAFWGAYAATKAAMEVLVRTWADEVDITPIRAVIVDPGRMRTRMRAEAFPGEDPQTLPDPAEIGPLIVDLCRPDKAPPSASRFQAGAPETVEMG
jgi:NAD(P)-dependent dehydrogenase (short-subunit alcohol dehydrogenase family)